MATMSTRIARDDLENEFTVSTVHLGDDCNFYETMVFAPNGDEAHCTRTRSHAQALTNHSEAIEQFKG